MIVVKLMGGLGNQMFQYAVGRRLARERGVPLKVDLSYFEAQKYGTVDTLRSYALDGWRVRASVATASELSRYQLTRPRLRRYGKWLFPPVIAEAGSGFDPAVLRAPRSAYLNGYWQSEKYFDSVRKLLLEDFSLSVPPCIHAASLADRMEDPRAIAVHVRRGDYLSNPAAATFHGVCSVEYYQTAMQWVAEQVSDAHFFVFGDDLEWAEESIRFPSTATFVGHDGDCLPHNDIWLMSLCSHHIIANSSFSWWGAWLAENPLQLVCAPRLWFRDERLNAQHQLPERWARL